ncbi:MAG: TonB-dependent receptor [Deltaproteobacteria bacterium]|nr:TonB-dependent receptor [Deltaproteobacteria bacterium]
MSLVWIMCLALVATPDASGGDEDAEPFEEVIQAKALDSKKTIPGGKSGSVITRSELEDRLPRSAPDALRFEPGVFVQQTAHSQGSAFIHGLTGQQTLLLFDGIRLNNTTFRQGPNQYFFTLDAQTIETIRIIRGGSSTRYGSDAIGGVIEALPTEAKLRGEPGFDSTAHLLIRGATADNEFGGRIWNTLQIGENLSTTLGVGWRRVGQLSTGGRIHDVKNGLPFPPPEWGGFGEDGVTQLGTGFNEATADAHIIWSPASGHRLKVAGYVYDQTDAPRTDLCPPPGQPEECLTYEEQFRSLVYGTYEYNSSGPIQNLRATLSWQRQHERRRFDHSQITGSLSEPINNVGRDDVDSLGFTLHIGGQPIVLSDNWSLKLSGGVDHYLDLVSSYAWRVYNDVNVTRQQSRGQYVDGAWHHYGGAYLEQATRFKKTLFLRAGMRAGWQKIHSPAELESSTQAIDRQSFPLAGHIGAEWRITPQVHLITTFDRSHRSPNINDLTARQQTGPGFQFENPDLKAEKANTWEVGTKLHWLPLIVNVFGFYIELEDAIVKSPRTINDCPDAATGCATSWSSLQLVNTQGTSRLYGAEASALARFNNGLSMRAAITYTYGESPDAQDPDTTVPLSRIPPLNGSAEVHYQFFQNWKVGTGMRWATSQTRLAPADFDDITRIPPGGTPGFAVFDLRLSYRAKNKWLASFVLENIFNTPYRYHGSSVNGSGVGAMILFDLGSIWGT